MVVPLKKGIPGLDSYLAQIGSLDKGNSVKVGEVSDVSTVSGPGVRYMFP